MNNKTKGILCLIMALISAYTYGLYTVSALAGKTIEPHRWALTGLFGLWWVYNTIDYLTRKD